VSIFFVPQQCSIKTEELPAVHKAEEAEEPLQDLDGESSGIEMLHQGNLHHAT
jgi:hypothetical protein